ncbi:Hypothetical protein PHPALM_8588 [Phytophthora palmivora]|uniref:Uncharacterized protein n=1 Tax=Phytophthora palmivora TaxID=4796 RepID=A0A2P4Y9V8_9STRA|nr:Hypothetical protein PHPALM_8588 [Phytophthora palmivora]
MRQTGGADGSFFRDQTVALRQTVATLLGLLRDAVVRDTKSPKQTLSKEALRILHQVLTPSISVLENETPSFRSNQVEPENEEIDPTQPRVVHRQTSLDVDEVIKGVLLVEGSTPTDAAECARIMGEKLKYLPVNLKQTLTQLQQDKENQAQAEREEEQRKLQLVLQQKQLQSEGQGTDGQSDITSTTSILPATAQVNPAATSSGIRPTPTLEVYVDALKKYLSDLMTAEGKRGFVMYNWPFSTRDVNLLTAMGLPIDSVINLEIVQKSSLSSTPIPPPTVATPAVFTPAAKPKTPVTTTKATPLSSNSSRPKAPVVSSAARGKTSPTKPTAASKSPPKPNTRATSKSRASPVKVPPTSASKPKTPTVPSTPVNPGSSSSQLQSKSSEAAKIVKKVPTAASALQGLGGLVHSVGPATFPVERVNAILQVLEQQKRCKLAPVIQWDDNTRRTNEMLAISHARSSGARKSETPKNINSS